MPGTQKVMFQVPFNYGLQDVHKTLAKCMNPLPPSCVSQSFANFASDLSPSGLASVFAVQ